MHLFIQNQRLKQTPFRSSHPELFLRKGVLKIHSKFTGEHPCWSAISIKLLCNFIKIALRHGCYTVNLLHIFRTPFLKTHLGGCFWKFLLIFHISYIYIAEKFFHGFFYQAGTKISLCILCFPIYCTFSVRKFIS